MQEMVGHIEQYARRVEQNVLVMAVQQLQHRWDEVAHCVIVAEYWRLVSLPQVGPDVGVVGADGADEPLGVVVEGGLISQYGRNAKECKKHTSMP